MGTLGSLPFRGTDGSRLTHMFSGTSICVMSYLGFDAISTLSEDTHDRTGKTMGRAILAVLGVATVMFVALAWMLGNLVVNVPIKDPAAATYEFLRQTVGPWAVVVLAWTSGIIVGFTNVLPMQVGVAKVLFAMGRDRQLPGFLAITHKRHGTPWVAMIFSTAISVGVAILLRDRVDDLTSMVNFGALCGFLMLHISVIAVFAVKRKSLKINRIVTPSLGILVVCGVLSGMNTLAIETGLAWTVLGLGYAVYLFLRKDLPTPESQLAGC